MIRHKYEPSAITPGRCGAGENLSPGHIVCCGQPEDAETHNQAKCPTCEHHFVPLDEPLCDRCCSYVPEAFEVIVRRIKQEREECTCSEIDEVLILKAEGKQLKACWEVESEQREREAAMGD